MNQAPQSTTEQASTEQSSAELGQWAGDQVAKPAEVPVLDPIWPNGVKIEVLGLTGALGSGKSLFGLLIDPVHTLCFDFEKSCGNFEALGFKRMDVPGIMAAKHPSGYKPLDVFKWWLLAVDKITPGKFSVITCDPISDLEIGLASYVSAKFRDHGFSSESGFQKMGGAFWGAVKNEWKAILVRLASKCQTFVFTTHLRVVWKGNSPTSKKEPKGKETLLELSSLYLWLSREADAKGNVPDVPSAEIVGSKNRLAHIAIVDGKAKITPLVPPRFDKATPDVIREYILKPPDYSKLKAKEKIQPEAPLTDREKLEMEAGIAQDRRATEETAAGRIAAEIEAQRAGSTIATQPTAAQQPATSGYVQPAVSGHVPSEGKASAEQQATLIEFSKQIGMPHERFLVSVMKVTGNSSNPGDLTEAQASVLIAKFQAHAKQQRGEIPF